jgi:hypothetical protein
VRAAVAVGAQTTVTVAAVDQPSRVRSQDESVRKLAYLNTYVK